jgi:hypothetical protein
LEELQMMSASAGAKIVLLGAEGCAESQGLPYLRDPLGSEIDHWRDALRPVITDDAINHLMIDKSNRPYWLKVVEINHPECPESVRRQLAEHLRMLRLAV